MALPIFLGYGTFALADFLGTVIPVILFGTASFLERASKWKMSEVQINEALSYFKVLWAVGFGLIKLGFRVFDATCPLVTKVHKEVARLDAQDCEIIMIGHKGHVEVEGTNILLKNMAHKSLSQIEEL